jgi:hypothetical protein
MVSYYLAEMRFNRSKSDNSKKRRKKSKHLFIVLPSGGLKLPLFYG